jgi:chitin synthase
VIGYEYNITNAKLPGAAQLGYNIYTRAGSESGFDVTPLFNRDPATFYPTCTGQTGLYATSSTCKVSSPTLEQCPLGDLNATNLVTLGITNTQSKVGYGWDDLASGKYPYLIIINGNVLNMEPYINANPNPVPTDGVDLAIRAALAMNQSGGKDATRMFYVRSDLKNAVPCLQQKYFAGLINKITPGCFVSDLFLYVSLTVILALVFVRFLMALYFSWFMSWRMSATPSDYGTGRMAYNQMPLGANANVDSYGAAPWANKQKPPPGKTLRMNHFDDSTTSLASTTRMTQAAVGNEPYVVCLITTYSEGLEGISTTLTSIAQTEYPDQKKLLFVVADGMVTGSGEKQSTPDICVGLLEADVRFGTPMPMSFISVAQGKKQHNMAMVYAGHYTQGKGRRTPMIVVVKCGTPEEAAGSKPGNRGKRDSQMILMNFLQRVTYNDRMTPLDFDLFRKFHALMGVTPDFFELCMMVDADTMVYPKGLRMLVNAMMRDHLIMGACGETRIANKKASWVTAIQVYEYFISHHMVKAFESVFGGVTCLPGCFSMYRIKARKPTDDDWVPIIVKPEVTREYSQSVVTTLHQKNLLLLGEDRFLTTLLLRTFPNRKMVFVPQARCRTEVPHTFKMLLSQRRRWINSTVHNLMELILVRDLCGTFCFSMQFVVFMDLVGTAVLPVAICLTYVLVVSYVLHPPHTFTEAIPLMLLIAVIGLPAVLILLATTKIVYVCWMLIYLIFLPVWNFILPLYSFWHFDDFSWGETRKVEGEGKDKGHGAAEGVFAAASVPLRRWEDWERSRLKRQAREEKRRKEMERQFGAGFHNDQKDMQSDLRRGPALPPHLGPRDDSDSISNFSGSHEDEDMWGPHIGTFNEEAPPPLAIVRHSIWTDGQEIIVEQDDMEKMLSQGWSEDGDNKNVIHATNMVGVGPPPRPSDLNARRSLNYRAKQNGAPAVPQIPTNWSNGGPVPQPRPPQLHNGNSYNNRFHPQQQPNPRYNLRQLTPSTTNLLPGALADRTPSPTYGEDVILLRGQGKDSSSYDREGGASTAVVPGNSYTHTRNRSSGPTQHFNGDPLQGGYRAPRN